MPTVTAGTSQVADRRAQTPASTSVLVLRCDPGAGVAGLATRREGADSGLVPALG